MCQKLAERESYFSTWGVCKLQSNLPQHAETNAAETTFTFNRLNGFLKVDRYFCLNNVKPL